MRHAAILSALAVLLFPLAVAGCGPSGAAQATYPPPSSTPGVPLTGAVTQTRAAIEAALGERQIVLNDTQTPFRPAESALLAGAPRAVYQAWLPQDQDHGMIVVYEFRDGATAAAAAAEEQQYLRTGYGLVQDPPGTVHVIRGLDTTVIVYDWLPAAAVDPKTPDIQAALETIGIGYPVD